MAKGDPKYFTGPDGKQYPIPQETLSQADPNQRNLDEYWRQITSKEGRKNWLNDLGTAALTVGSQFRRSTGSELEQGRQGWKGRSDLFTKAGIWWGVDALTAGAMGRALPKATSIAVKRAAIKKVYPEISAKELDALPDKFYRSVYLDDALEKKLSKKFNTGSREELLDALGTRIPGNTNTYRKGAFDQTLFLGDSPELAKSHLNKYTNPKSWMKVPMPDPTTGRKYLLEVVPNKNIKEINEFVQREAYQKLPKEGYIIKDQTLTPELLKSIGSDPAYKYIHTNPAEVGGERIIHYLGKEGEKIGDVSRIQQFEQGGPVMAKKTLSAEKAKQILKDGKVNGKLLTAAQKRYFGFIAGGGVPSKELGGDLQKLGLGDWIKDNSQGIIGGLKTIAGIALTATGAGAAAGAPLIASGIGDIGKEISGDQADKQLAENQVTADQQTTMNAYKQNKTQQLYNTANANSSFQPKMMKYGGPINYSGQTHKGPNSGIPVDGQGNPSIVTKQEPVALTENGETAWMTPEGTPYVFPVTMQADVNKVFKKHEMRLGKDFSNPDKISQKSLQKSLGKLMAQNETIKTKKEASKQKRAAKKNMNAGILPDMMAKGGRLPKLEDGDWPSFLLADRSSPVFADNNLNFSDMQSTLPEILPDAITDPIGFGAALGKTPGNYISQVTSTGAEAKPWSPFVGQAIGSGINAGLGALGNVLMARNLPEPEKIRTPLITAPQINLAPQRIQADVDAAEARSRVRGRSREAGLSKSASQALFNAADARITGQTGAGKSQSLLAEETTNKQNQFQAAAQNQVMQSRAAQIDALRRDQQIRDKFGLYSSALQNLTGGASDIMKAYQDSQFLNMVGARSGYELLKKKGSPAYLSQIKGYWDNRVGQ